jgi:NDP-sugar pyrophosphorylase family protein
MAGLGKRFSSAGYKEPKPLLPIHGIPMYKVVLANLMHESIKSITMVCPKGWNIVRETQSLESNLGIPVNVVEIDYVTEGPAITVALARPFLTTSLPVVVANSDQYINADLSDFYKFLLESDIDGSILCMEDSDPKWSYVRVTNNGLVSEVREKEVISRFATVGIYGFRSASLMFTAFQEMINQGDTTQGEYYVAPCYQYLINNGLKIQAMNLGLIGDVMYGLGIPSDYEVFLRSSISEFARQKSLNLFSQ